MSLEPLITSFQSNPELIWIAVGVICLILEVFIPSLIIIFFGVACLAAGASLHWFEVGFGTQIIVFCAFSFIPMLTLRKILLKHFDKKKTNTDDFQGETAIALDDFADGYGKVIFKGTHWKATSPDKKQIKKGDRVTITQTSGISLIVTSE